LSPYSLNFIFGPRQVGKSTALILLIKRLLEEERANPKSIFYFSCDKLADYRELDEIIGEYMKFKRANNISSSFIFLDEITYPREWYRALKSRIDGGTSGTTSWSSRAPYLCRREGRSRPSPGGEVKVRTR
jgi:predicted AAA+ superfamily ATPase